MIDAARRVLGAYYYIVPGDVLIPLAESTLADERLSDLAKAVGPCVCGRMRRGEPLVGEVDRGEPLEVQRKHDEWCK